MMEEAQTWNLGPKCEFIGFEENRNEEILEKLHASIYGNPTQTQTPTPTPTVVGQWECQDKLKLPPFPINVAHVFLSFFFFLSVLVGCL